MLVRILQLQKYSMTIKDFADYLKCSFHVGLKT